MNAMLQLTAGPYTAPAASAPRRAVRSLVLVVLVALTVALGGAPPAGAADPPGPATPFGDLNGDGWSDMLVRITDSGSLVLYRGSQGGFAPPVQVGRGWNGMNAITRHGDMSGDTHEDVVARDGAGALWLYPGTGTGTSPAFAARVRIGASGWNGMREITPVGDLDGDGKGDLVAAQASTGELFLYPGLNGALGPRRPLGRGWNGMDELTGMGDVGRDGSTDLLARHVGTSDVWLYSGTGTGPSARLGTRAMVGAGSTGWAAMESFAGLGDIDRDGSNDLAAVFGKTLIGYGLKNGHLYTSMHLGSGFGRNYRPIL